MRYYQQQNRNRLTIGQDGNALTMLLAINLVVFVIIAFIRAIYFFSYGKGSEGPFNADILHWVALPASMDSFLTRPWTLFTHMFVHSPSDYWHIIGNMIWLWSFGYIFQDLAGNRKIFPMFFYGAIAGAVAYVLSYNFIGPLRENLEQSYAIGASAGIMAIAIGATTLAPNYRIFPMLNGGIPLWVITLFYLIMDLALLPYTNPGGHIAHLAGALIGFIVIRRVMAGSDWTLWMSNFYDWCSNLFNPDRPKKGTSIKSHLFYKSGVQPFTKTPTITQQKVDEILEKIHQKGYSSLTEDEKELLRKASQEGI
jgi:membrane associated rhomboid family serine protease